MAYDGSKYKLVALQNSHRAVKYSIGTAHSDTERTVVPGGYWKYWGGGTL